MEQKQEKFSTIGYIAAALGMSGDSHEYVRRMVEEHLF